MKTTFKNRQNRVAVNNEISAPRVNTVRVETDAPEIRQAWFRLYEAIMGKRRLAQQKA